jgi:hypothetical protein
LTGNIEQPNGIQTKGIFKPKRWRPAGRITVEDDVLGTIPLVGANVHARWSTHVESGITDSNGRFSTGLFIYNVNYAIKWDRYEYSIRSGTFGQAWCDGPKQKGDWNLNIPRGNTQSYYATIHHAAHHFYYGNIGLLTYRPPQNAFWKSQMKIAAMYETNDKLNGRYSAPLRFLGVLNQIKIWRNERTSDGIYGTTIHELAHAAHWNISSKTFNNAELILQESWARGVQWYLTRMLYPNYSTWYRHKDYTGIVEDMVDGVQGLHWHYNVNDNVSGYTMSQMESSILHQTTWDGWRDNIINMYNNATEGNLQVLFSDWNTKQP